jgi:hypothetical protein
LAPEDLFWELAGTIAGIVHRDWRALLGVS